MQHQKREGRELKTKKKKIARRRTERSNIKFQKKEQKE